MRYPWMGISVVVVLAMGALGCQSKLHQENQALWQQNRELQAEKTRLEGELRSRPDPSQLAAMQGEIAAREQRIAELEAQLRAPQPGQMMDDSLAGITVTRNDALGTVTVNLPGDVLFDSGQAELKPSAKATLNKVAAALKKDYAGKKIFVEGHTDSDPINRTRNQWKDNLDLSAARARAVAAYLQQQGVDPKLIGTRAFGPTQPRATKAQSRRVEIVVATR